MIRIMNRVEGIIVGVLGLCMLALATFQVATRYLLPGYVTSGMEELIVYIFVWAAMIACAERVSRIGHIRADLLLRKLSPRQLRVAELFGAFLSLVLCVGLTWYGAEVVQIAHLIDERSQTGVSFPMWIFYLALPVGAGLMSLRYVDLIYRLAFDYESYCRLLADSPEAPTA